jgi:AraC-like DNA-binding protein
VNKVNKFDSIEEKITKAMKESKIFLNSRLTVKQLAKELGSNEKYVSNIINQRYQMNFSNFVNDFRIKHATEILLDEKYKNFTIEAIGGLSGFSSKSAFNATFKKVNGITPSEYKIRNTL